MTVVCALNVERCKTAQPKGAGRNCGLNSCGGLYNRFNATNPKNGLSIHEVLRAVRTTSPPATLAGGERRRHSPATLLVKRRDRATGKTTLAGEEWPKRWLQWHIKSTTKAQLRDCMNTMPSRDAIPQWAKERSRTSVIHFQGVLTAGLRRRCARCAADRRNRQDRHRVSQRSIARTRPHGVPRLRDARNRCRAAHRNHHFHHLNNEKELPDAFPAALLLPLHPFPDADTMIQLSMRIFRASRKCC